MLKKILSIVVVVIIIVVVAYVSYTLYLNKYLTNTNAVEETTVEVLPSQNAPVIINNATQQVVISAPVKKDTDKDGLDDEKETQLKTNINQKDTDEDGLSDFEEVMIYGTDPNHVDTDRDGFFDGVEIKSGYNPKGDGQLLDLTRALNQ